MAIPFLNEIITFGTLTGVAIGGYFQITGKLKRDAEMREQRIKSMIDNADQSIKAHLDKKIELVDTKFTSYDTKIEKTEEDVADIEIDMKNMVQDFREMCDKLSRHDYIITDIVPEFKSLQKEFNNFKSSIDQHLLRDKQRIVNKELEPNHNIGTDMQNRKNINKQGDIQE